MKSETIGAIHDKTLEARKVLLAEVSDQLEGIFGFLPNGSFMDASAYPALSIGSAPTETRRKLESLLRDESQAGLKASYSREKLIQEVAFTWLNRLIAFKMLETRKILRQTITRLQESNGFKFWLTEPGHECQLSEFEAGELPHDSLGEGPRHRAYREFLLAQCQQLSLEIPVLFDVSNLASRLCPRPAALNSIIGLLNSNELQEAWEPGNEDAIGWVYQFFIEQRKQIVLDRMYKKKEKIRAEDIPAATQIFTPRWIVRSLIENTLGRTWIQMHPDSRLREKLQYLIPEAAPMPRLPLKPVKEIKLLDPACGTMHFGLVAFDLFVEMYKEELERAGESPEWTKESSVESEENIANAVLAYNLHGIDIDLRAVQLSGLTLYLKAKTLNPKATLPESKLVCSNIHMLNANRLTTYLKSADLPEATYKRLLDGLCTRLKNSDELGSLIRIADEIRSVIDEEQSRFKNAGGQLLLQGSFEKTFASHQDWYQFWERIEVIIGKALDDFTVVQESSGQDEDYLALETRKGLRLLEISGQKYDVVVTNPPYLSRRNMSPTIRNFLRTEYKTAKADLYAAFIQRCCELTVPGGRVGMITQQSFMFISFYKQLRPLLRQTTVIEGMIHVGTKAFYEIKGEKVNATAFFLRKEDDSETRQSAIGTYIRVTQEENTELKKRRFESALDAIRSKKSEPCVFLRRQDSFDLIPKSPWVYWLSDNVKNAFETLPSLDKAGNVEVGCFTCDNFRFVRFFWEVPFESIQRNCTGGSEVLESSKWIPYMKGGGYQPWYGNLNCVVNYSNGGLEIREKRKERGQSYSLPGEEFYFHEGITYSYLTSGRFSARMLPAGCVFDVAGSSVFTKYTLPLLGILNSKVADYILKLINPTYNFQKGDIERLPVPRIETLINLGDLVERCVALAKEEQEENETSFEFIAPPQWAGCDISLSNRRKELLSIHEQMDHAISQLYGVSDQDFDPIQIDEEPDLLVEDETEDIAQESQQDDGDDLQPSDFTLESIAKRWISYAVGIVMGRFHAGQENGLGRGRFQEGVNSQLRSLRAPDGVLVVDKGHANDMATKVIRALQIMLGEDGTWQVISEATGETGDSEELLRSYFSGPFFKEHVLKNQYRSRPIYWLLQSPQKKYSLWLFHEKLTKDSLYRIRGEQYLGSKIRLLETELAALTEVRDKSEGKTRRDIEKQLDPIEDALADIREFALRIDKITEAGYSPHMDDGVLISMAPLWQLIPAWQSELKECWKELEKGDYDWSHQAMAFWAERVMDVCKNKQSFAIAHGITRPLAETITS